MPLAPPVTTTMRSLSRIAASSAALGRAALRFVPPRDLLAGGEPDPFRLAHEFHEVFEELHARGPPADEGVARQHEAGVLLVHRGELRGPEVEDPRGIRDDV